MVINALNNKAIKKNASPHKIIDTKPENINKELKAMEQAMTPWEFHAILI